MSPYDKAFIDPIRRQGHGSWFRTLAVPMGGSMEFTPLKRTRSNAVNLGRVMSRLSLQPNASQPPEGG